MPRNGAGGYALPSGNPVVTGTTISSTDFNNTMTDIGTAIAGSIAADGQTAWQGNQNANNNRITSLAAAAALTDAPNAGDVQTGKLTYLAAVAGTNTITATVGFLVAYTAGEVFRFIAANTNTGAATLNVNSIGAIAITKQGATALVAGDIVAGAMVSVAFDGTRFQLQTPTQLQPGQLLSVRVITSTQVYTPTAGTTQVIVLAQGGGGGGGGTAATGAGQQAAGGGGGAGGWALSYLTSGFSGVTATIGAAGAAIVGANGGNGGTTSFGGLMSATGGTGGGLGAAVSTTLITFSRGSVGGLGSGNMVSGQGGAGGAGLYTSTGGVLSGAGGMGYHGAGGSSVIAAANGDTSNSPGGGGSGSAQSASGAAAFGGAGAAGRITIWEYA